jgi:drug/metabolite transporter (DMT)-like permease
VEDATMAAWLGPAMVLLFCVSQAVRDVYFANVFQGVDYFAVILLAFLPSTLIFGAITAAKAPGEFATLRGHLGTVLAMMLTTALAWTCYFFALTHLEPSIVNTLHSGMGPLTVIALAACGLRLAKPGVVSRQEAMSYAGIALALVGLWWVVLSGQSGLPHADHAASLIGLVLVLVSGSSITVSLLFSKRLHDHGVSPEAVTAVRYIALILLAGGVEAWQGRLAGIEHLGDLLALSLIATALIALPTFALQIGVARTAPLTAHVLRSLGPVCVFGVQQLDGRLAYSAPTLICILGYSAAAIAGNIAHGWREQPAEARG